MSHSLSRRTFLQTSSQMTVAVGIAALAQRAQGADSPSAPFKISLAEWSLHKSLGAKKVEHLNFAALAKEYGIDAIEYVNTFFKSKAQDQAYLGEMRKRADDLGVKSLLIMIDAEGAIGDPDEAKRTKALENHHQWVEAAKFLGCHSIRVNAQSRGTPEEQKKLVADGLTRLAEFAKPHDINIIVENHGGISSNGAWLAGVMKQVGLPNCGTLPDFGNFNLGGKEKYDRYLGVEELMPFAKAVSAKSYDFDAEGNEKEIDYRRMMKIVLAAGYHGYVGIEYEGSRLSEPEGIVATRVLLEKIRDELA